LISEIIGEFGLDENIIYYVDDARKRLLKPSPIILPEELEIYIYPFESNAFYSYYLGNWLDKFYGLDFSDLAEYYKKNVIQIDFNFPHRPLSKPVLVSKVDLRSASENKLETEVTIKTDDIGMLHGFCGFFKAKLTGDIHINSSPLQAPTCWRNLCFPISKPKLYSEFDEIKINIKGTPTNEYMDWKLNILK